MAESLAVMPTIKHKRASTFSKEYLRAESLIARLHCRSRRYEPTLISEEESESLSLPEEDGGCSSFTTPRWRFGGIALLLQEHFLDTRFMSVSGDACAGLEHCVKSSRHDEALHNERRCAIGYSSPWARCSRRRRRKQRVRANFSSKQCFGYSKPGYNPVVNIPQYP